VVSPFPACRVPARLPACGTVQAAPFGHRRRLALVPGHDVNLVDLHLVFERHLWGLGDQAAAQLLRHDLHVRTVQTQFQGDLPVREVQAHEVEAQHPHAQRLVMSGQHRAGQVIEASRTRLTPVALPAGLRVVAPVPDDGAAVTCGAARTVRPAVLTHQREALGVVDQARKVDQVGCRHDKSSSREQVSYSRSCSRTRPHQPDVLIPASPPRNPIRASWITHTRRERCLVSMARRGLPQQGSRARHFIRLIWVVFEFSRH